MNAIVANSKSERRRRAHMQKAVRENRHVNPRKLEVKIDGETVRPSRYNAFKNLRRDKVRLSLDRDNVYKQRKALLIRKDLTMAGGKRRTVLSGTTELGFRKGPVRFCISGGKLALKPESDRNYALSKNLKFLLCSGRTCRPLRYVANYITDYGCSRRLFFKIQLALNYSFIGKTDKSYMLIRSIAGRLGSSRWKTSHATRDRVSDNIPRRNILSGRPERPPSPDSDSYYGSDESDDW